VFCFPDGWLTHIKMNLMPVVREKTCYEYDSDLIYQYIFNDCIRA